MIHSSMPKGRTHGHSTRRPVRVLIVDDSQTVQSLLRHVLARDPRIEVVGAAADPYAARDMIKQLNPDVLTLDVEMPRMNGLEFLERLMRLRPMPVVMLSGMTQSGSDAAIRALALGAMDCIAKPGGHLTEEDVQRVGDSIVAAARARPMAGAVPTPPRLPEPRMRPWNGRVVLMGASTGGVAAVEAVLAGLPPDGPPVVIAQHMPPGFLASFVQRLDSHFPLSVQPARDGVVLEPGHVYLSPGGAVHTGICQRGGRLACSEIEAPRRNGHVPSIDILFESALDQAPKVTAVLLTGLGQDGAVAMKSLKDLGAHCIGQDEATSVVYGMPRAAADLGALTIQLPLERIAEEIIKGPAPVRRRIP